MNRRIKYMFDTVAFNRIVEQDISLKSLIECCEICATHIQRDELNATRDGEKKAKLLESCHWVETRGSADGVGMVPTESGVYGISRYGGARYSDGSYRKQIQSALDKRKKKANNIKDALIAETAIENGFILVTEDKVLQNVAREHGGDCISFEEFLQCCHQ